MVRFPKETSGMNNTIPLQLDTLHAQAPSLSCPASMRTTVTGRYFAIYPATRMSAVTSKRGWSRSIQGDLYPLSPAVPLRDATDKQRFPEQGRAAKRAGIMTRYESVTAPHTGTGQATAQPAAPLSLPAPSSMHIVRTGRSSQTCSGFSRGHVAWTTVLHLHSQHAM